jgi:hypothetical protein
LTIRDRGKVKWQCAFFMPEHVKMLGELRTDYYRQAKPQLDGYQYDEIDDCLSEAMAENKAVKITVWRDGFTTDVIGKVHVVDPLTQQLRIESRPGKFEGVKFADMIGVVISDN